MNTFWQDINYKIKSGSKLYLLITINVVVFLIINIPAGFERMTTGSDSLYFYTYNYLSLPSYLPVLVKHFWTPVTYMFMHADIKHILYNMLWLFWFGQIFEEFLGRKRTVGLYFLGGLGGAAFFVLCYNVLPIFTQSGAVVAGSVVGASGSVIAVVVAAATTVPDYEISLFGLIQIKLKWIAAFLVLTGFLGMSGPNAGGEIAHLGGALVGFVYVKQLQSGKDWIASFGNLFKKRSNMRVVPGNQQKETSTKPHQAEIDRILDKISETGYDNLTKQERETLFRASNK